LPESFGLTDRVVLYLDQTNQVVIGRGSPDDVPSEVSQATLDELKENHATVVNLGGGDRWIASSKQPVFDPTNEEDSGWSVIVAERESAVLGPLISLWKWSFRIGVGALVVVLVVLVVIIPVVANQIRRVGIATHGKTGRGDQR
jgi:hypothetical protein